MMPPRPPVLTTALLAGGLIALTLLTYGPALGNGFIWDDPHYVTENPTLRSAAGLVDIWTKLGATPQYYPLVHTTFWLEFHAWGLQPFGYHVVNMLLHATSAVLAWRLLSRLDVPGAWLAAALFAVHPVNVESVAWITERKNVLSLALALGSMLAFLRFAPPQGRQGSWGWYFLALVLFVGALLSKTVTASVPAVLLVIYWWKRGALPGREAGWLLPFFAVGLAFSSVTAWMERNVVGANGAEWVLEPAQRLVLAGRAVWFYGAKLAWPNPLIFFYPRWTIDARIWWQWMFPISVAVLLIGMFLARQRIGRGPLAAVLIFVGVLTPALGFFDVFPFRYSFVADHFQYHASLALLALAAAGAALLPRSVFHTLAAAVLTLLVLVSWTHAKTFRDLESLYRDIIAKNLQCWVAHLNLATYFQDTGRPDEAMAEYQASLAIKPNPMAWSALLGTGTLLAARKDRAAVPILEQALELAPPSLGSYTHFTAATAFHDLEQYDQAIDHYRKSMSAVPVGNSFNAQLNIAVCLEAQKQYQQAIDQILQIKQVPPNFAADLYVILAKCYEKLGKSREAQWYLRQAKQAATQ